MTDEPLPNIEDRIQAQKHLRALEAFMEGVAYAGYVAAKKAEVAILDQQILDGDVNDIGSLLKLLDLKGQRKMNVEAVTTFEDARNTLKKRVDDMIEREDKLRQQMTENET